MPTAIKILAPAKINLHLHITGRAENGFHLLDSLVAFTDIADEIVFQPANIFKLQIEGNNHLAEECKEQDNLVSKAIHLYEELYHPPSSVLVTLKKNIPVGAGLGGGSADAATTLKALRILWETPLTEGELTNLAMQLGSDVTACLSNSPCIMRGIGHEIHPAPQFPELYAVLAKPPTSCNTQSVYKTYAQSQKSFSDHSVFPEKFSSSEALCTFLNQSTRNDLTEAAIAVNSDVKEVLTSLEKITSSMLVRLSGSGSTCFALFENYKEAQDQALHLSKNHPSWWIKATKINAN